MKNNITIGYKKTRLKIGTYTLNFKYELIDFFSDKDKEEYTKYWLLSLFNGDITRDYERSYEKFAMHYVYGEKKFSNIKDLLKFYQQFKKSTKSGEVLTYNYNYLIFQNCIGDYNIEFKIEGLTFKYIIYNYFSSYHYTNIYKTLEFDEVYFKLTNEIRKEKIKQLETI